MRFIFLALMLAACAPKTETNLVSGTGDSLRNSMPFKSTSPWWATDINPNTQNQVIHFVMAYDQECESVALLQNGTMTISNSTQISQPQSTDLNCSYWDGSWTYDGSNGLTICKTSPNVEPCATLE